MIDREFAASLASRFGTPLYAYDLAEVERRAKALLSVLPDESLLLYSLKANPLPAIGAALRKLGCGAEVSSSGELSSALEAGFHPSKILYTGPAKTEAEIAEALGKGVVHFSCESLTEILRLNQAAAESEAKVTALLRINPSTPPKARLAMSGVPSQFGFEEEVLVSHLESLKALDRVEIAGIHVYFGTQIQEAEALLSAFARAVETGEQIAEKIGYSFRILNVGGGFPWPYATQGQGLDPEELARGLKDLSQQRRGNRSAQLWFESGRYLTASSGMLLASVMDVKESKGSKYIVLDAGINHLGGMTGLGRVLRPLISVDFVEPKARGPETFDVVGPLCTPLDCLGRGIEIPRPRVGELVSIPNVGAYGLTASLIAFLSRPSPAEVVHVGDEIVEAYRFGARQERIA